MWCAEVQVAGRSHPGQTHPRSRTLSAFPCAPEITRRARPTSITVESDPSSTRVTVQSHASLSTAFDEIGNENSISAAGAPERPRRVSSEVVTCMCVR